MSFDASWRMPGLIEGERWRAVVQQVAAAHGATAEFREQGSGFSAIVRMPRAFVEQHDQPSRSHDGWYIGELQIRVEELYPITADGCLLAAEPHALTDSAGGGVADVTSVCRAGDDVLVGTRSGHTFVRTPQRWFELDWPADFDGELPRVVGWDGVSAWAGSDRLFQIRDLQLHPVEGDTPLDVSFIGGVGGLTVVVDESSAVHVRNESGWRVIDRGTLGLVTGLASGTSGTFLSAGGAALARVDAERLTPIECAAGADDELTETSALAVAPDGSVWLTQRGVAACYRDGTWTVTELPFDEPPLAIVVDDVPVVLAQHHGATDAVGATWNGAAWTPFRLAAGGRLYTACGGPDHEIIAGGDSRVVVLERRGPRHVLEVRSSRSGNSEVWISICKIAQNVGKLLGAGPTR